LEEREETDYINLFIKEQFGRFEFLLASRNAVLNFMVKLCRKFKKRCLRGVEEVTRKYATKMPRDVHDCSSS